MKIVFQTNDGMNFDNEQDARVHEAEIGNSDSLIMLNRHGEVVNKTKDAWLIYLKNEAANLAFFALAESQGDYGIEGLEKGEDHGLFYWSEWDGGYKWVPNTFFATISAFTREADKRGIKL